MDNLINSAFGNGINHNQPAIMHIDLNSCFATIEQQANIHFRGKPLVVAAYSTPKGFVLAPSIEAKRLGIRLGMTVRDARLICRDVIVRTPDPPKIRDVHVKFKRIFQDYAPKVTPKSIDEAVLDFTDAMRFKPDLVSIAKEIKQRMRKEIGEWISCSIGIGTNRFLAKTGASLKKPDGLEVITHQNLLAVLKRLTLMDLNGINEKLQARLNINGIFTPLQFFEATEAVLRKRVFGGIVGYYWYLRLRGWEIDSYEFGRKSYGQQYALGKPTADPAELSSLLMKLCEKMGRRLRSAGHAAQGIHIAVNYRDYTHWHEGKKFDRDLYTTIDLYRRAQWMLNRQPEKKVVGQLSVSCYGLVNSQNSQMNLFDIAEDKRRHISDAMDKINDRYGEFVVTPATMMSMDGTILDRIAFGRVNDIEDMYGEEDSWS